LSAKPFGPGSVRLAGQLSRAWIARAAASVCRSMVRFGCQKATLSRCRVTALTL